jgi:hypothetical protein
VPPKLRRLKASHLALNRDGAVTGVLYDQLTQQQIALNGAVDKAAQRLVVRLEGDDAKVVEMGLYNLTQPQVPVLIHFGADRQEMRYLIPQQPPANPQQ